jgi:hypothetical protein
MSQHDFYKQAAINPVEQWPKWVVTTECGSSYHFDKKEAEKSKAEYESEGVKATLMRVEFS